MEVYFSHYELVPKRRVNNLSNLTPKSGVFLRTGDLDFRIVDYFPHENLGDQTVDQFLEKFPDESHPYHRSIIRQLRTIKEPLPQVPFLNHQLWQSGAEIESPVIKYKIMDKDDSIPSNILNSDCKIRLDGNGIFEEAEIFKFLSKMNIHQIARIEYIEDPCLSPFWSTIPIPTAKDFINGNSYQRLIYKPNRNYEERIPEDTVFSGYMGNPLGLLHAYKELISRGNLKLHHGLLTPGIYEDEPSLFSGNYRDGFVPNQTNIQLYLSEIQDRTWSHLCSI